MRLKSWLAAPLLAALLFPAPASAQFGKMMQKAKERANAAVDKATDKALDKAEQKVKCAVGDDECVAKAKAEGKEVEVTGSAEQAGAPAARASAGAATAAAAKPAPKTPGMGAWANYDFVPGERVLFAEDFTRDRVGNFPKRVELEEGNMEVVEWDGRRWLRNTTDAEFTLVLPEALPTRWTMEFEVAVPWNGLWVNPGDAGGTCGSCEQTVYFDGTAVRATSAQRKTSVIDPRTLFGGDAMQPEVDGKTTYISRPFKVRFQADGGYLKVYMDEQRVVNMPNMGAWTGNKIHFHFNDNTVSGTQYTPMFTNLTVNAGGRELYDALMADGRVTTQGIYFDTGSDRIRPESSGTLREIADMLSEHGELKLMIEGHTDNVGDAAANQSLSEKRAAAVKAALSAAPYGVDASRLATKGLGAAKPKSPNTTPEGRQNNRRVELVKM